MSETEIDAMNIALAHIEGRRGVFSTRNPRTVIAILRQALGEHVNEHRGAVDRHMWEGSLFGDNAPTPGSR